MKTNKKMLGLNKQTISKLNENSIDKAEMQNINGEGWSGWAGLYVGVVAIACPPCAAVTAIAGVALGAYDLIAD